MKSIVLEKSRLFAIRIIQMYKYICDTKKDYIISKQILRSGTSIGANIAEAEYAFSKKDFLAKMYIALKECAETLYWLDLLYETEYLNINEYQSLKSDCLELQRILSSITKTTKQNS